MSHSTTNTENLAGGGSKVGTIIPLDLEFIDSGRSTQAKAMLQPWHLLTPPRTRFFSTVSVFKGRHLDRYIGDNTLGGFFLSQR